MDNLFAFVNKPTHAFYFILLLFIYFSYDPRDNKWTVLADMSTPRALAGCTVYKNKIYIIGKTWKSGAELCLI